MPVSQHVRNAALSLLVLAGGSAALGAWANTGPTQQSRWGKNVGFDDYLSGPDNRFIYCVAPSGVQTNAQNQDYVTTRFRNFKSNGLFDDNYVAGTASQQARIQCFPTSSRTGSPLVTVGSASTDSGTDLSTATCPAGTQFGKYPECSIHTDTTIPRFLYYQSACGNGVSSMGNTTLRGQMMGQSPPDYLDHNLLPTGTLYNDTTAASVSGADLGYIYYQGHDLNYVFGDTANLRPNRTIFAHQTIANSGDQDPSNGLDLTFITGSNGAALQPVPSLADEGGGGAIPSGSWSITENGTTYRYMWLMSIKTWQDSGGVLRVNRGAIGWNSPANANPSDNSTWNRTDDTDHNGSFDNAATGTWWPEDSSFTNVAVWYDITGSVGQGQGWLYIFGFKADGNMPTGTSGIKLMRVRARHADITDKSKYSYWNPSTLAWVPLVYNTTTHSWTAEPPDLISPATLGGGARELSVVYNSYANRFMMFVTPAKVLQAPTVTSTWTVVGDLPAAAWAPYAPLTHDRLLEDQGQRVYFLQSEFWGTTNQGQYNVGLWRADVTATLASSCYTDPWP